VVHDTNGNIATILYTSKNSKSPFGSAGRQNNNNQKLKVRIGRGGGGLEAYPIPGNTMP
jgi:hypothetical protein